MSDAALSCHDVTVRFGEFQALTDVSIAFETGRITALIGPNGAGKTTLLNVLSGLQVPTSGTVRLRDADVTKESNHRRAAKGIARSFQIISIYPAMSVLENVRLGIQQAGPRKPSYFLRRVDRVRALHEKTMQHLEQYGLASRADLLAGELSHGEQRALELSLSLTGDPSVLLLDEPLAGVGHGEADVFLDLIARAVKGRTTVLVEHNMDAVMGLADAIVCMVGGKVMASGTPQEIQADPRVRRAYLGE